MQAINRWDCLTLGSKRMVLSLLETKGIEAAKQYIEICFNVPDLPKYLCEGEEMVLGYIRRGPRTTQQILKHFASTIKMATAEKYLTRLKKLRLVCIRYNPEVNSPCWAIGDSDLSLVEYIEDQVLETLINSGPTIDTYFYEKMPGVRRTARTALRSLSASGIIDMTPHNRNWLCSLVD